MLSLVRFHWLRIIGAICALILAILYLSGFEEFSLIGFALIGGYGAITCIRLQKGTQPARCDLCSYSATMKAEYEHGFINTKLVITCDNCGRVVNLAKQGIRPGKEK